MSSLSVTLLLAAPVFGHMSMQLMIYHIFNTPLNSNKILGVHPGFDRFPYPRDNNGAYLPWQASLVTVLHTHSQCHIPGMICDLWIHILYSTDEPMVSDHPQICHGLDKDTEVRDGNAFSVGDTITIDLYGSASHNGGHCTFWYSTDDETFTKIIDIVDCTLNGAQVVLPNTMPTECEDMCTFAFSWVPVSSGACEIYMGCADISVAGASGGIVSHYIFTIPYLYAKMYTIGLH